MKFAEIHDHVFVLYSVDGSYLSHIDSSIHIHLENSRYSKHYNIHNESTIFYVHKQNVTISSGIPFSMAMQIPISSS